MFRLPLAELTAISVDEDEDIGVLTVAIEEIDRDDGDESISAMSALGVVVSADGNGSDMRVKEAAAVAA